MSINALVKHFFNRIMERKYAEYAGDYMSGRRIDDHASWIGKPGKGMVLPDGGGKTKMESSAEGAGHEGTQYSDTTEMIKRDQDHGISKIKGHPMKSGYRY